MQRLFFRRQSSLFFIYCVGRNTIVGEDAFAKRQNPPPSGEKITAVRQRTIKIPGRPATKMLRQGDINTSIC